MKKIVIALILATVTFGVHAQISKGTFLLGGSVGFNSMSAKYISNGVTTPQGTTTTFSVIPQAGYFVTNQIAAGIGLTINSISYKANGASTSLNNTRFLFSPFARYYFPQKIYLQAGVDIGSSTASSTGNGGSNSNSLFGWTLLGGYPVFLNESIAVEPQLGYNSLTDKIDSANKTTEGNFFIRVGFQIYFAKK
ncbi:MAG TPA: outer membrane beta-barrel protein [Cyclobacteriaceae bacterium]|nr:outer membrane beta-barrel protein [Cyclobacteriaceae bacterium]